MCAKACQETVEHSGHLKFFSAVFYAGSSFLITVVNKTVLTSFRYVALCHSFTWCQCTEGADGNTMMHAPLCNQPTLLLFTCRLVLQVSLLPVSGNWPGKLSRCPDFSFPSSLSVTHSQTLEVTLVLPDDHHSCCPICCQNEQNNPVPRLRQKYSLKSKPFRIKNTLFTFVELCRFSKTVHLYFLSRFSLFLCCILGTM